MKRTTIGILTVFLALSLLALTGCGADRGQPELLPDPTPLLDPDLGDGYVDDDTDGVIDDHGSVRDDGMIGDMGPDAGTTEPGSGNTGTDDPMTTTRPTGTPAPTDTPAPAETTRP